MRLFLAIACLLVAAPAAQAGGFATVGMSSTPADREWTVDITVLQHGVTPLTDVTPHVDIASGATTRTFAARPTGEPGVYRAEVVFPHGGEWTYQVRDGFTDVSPHTFKAVTIPGGPAAGSGTGGDGGIDLALLVPGLLLLLAAAAVLVLVPRTRRAPEPAL
ncbi:MAG TPA: FixH family protein [Solirubrobacteraceae bacterium]|nr:FixH family protein [Solirubrobacteraceae bacterium]